MIKKYVLNLIIKYKINQFKRYIGTKFKDVAEWVLNGGKTPSPKKFDLHRKPNPTSVMYNYSRRKDEHK